MSGINSLTCRSATMTAENKLPARLQNLLTIVCIISNNLVEPTITPSYTNSPSTMIKVVTEQKPLKPIDI